MNVKNWKILRVLTTNRCNYECVYCHNEGQGHKGRNDLISLSKFIRFYKIFSTIGIEEVRFSGGEPLMNPETIEMIKWLDEHSDVEIGIATNGSLVTEEIAKDLSNTRVMATLHFPGVGTEKYYKVTNRKWNLFEKCVKLFDAYNVDYSFNYTLYPETFDALDEVVEYSMRKGKRVKLLPFLDSEFSNFSEKLIPQIVDRMNLRNGIYEYYKKGKYNLWTFENGGAVKMIDSPCYEKNIHSCKEYGEIRLLPDLSLMGCIFGENWSTDGLSDDEILELAHNIWSKMTMCEDLIKRR